MAADAARAVFKEVSEHSGRGDTDAALRLLGSAVRQGTLSAEGIEKAGRLVTKLRSAANAAAQPAVRVQLLGQCTTSWVANLITAAAWAQGMSVHVREGEYDNVLQELLSPAADEPAQVTVLVPWTQRLVHDTTRPAEQCIDDEVAFWSQAWELAAKAGAKVVQVGYDWVTPGALGHHLSGRGDGLVALVRRVNDALRAKLPPGAFFVDLEQVSGTLGRSAFYDPRRYYWTKQPFSEEGALALAMHVVAGVRAVMTGPKKVLVLDLDNTLWGGVVGETGPLGIALGDSPDGEAYRSFQREVKALAARGVVLTIASKNNRDDALAPFRENPEMVLALSDFAHVEAHWEPKSESLRRTAEALNLGLDSFVFFDDNPAEREQVRQALPDVTVVEVPDDPSGYVRALHAGLWFEAASLSSEDLLRTGQYQQEHQRRELQASFASMDDYLTSLEMQATLSPIDATTLQRVVQLIGKTNQFNVTTRRHSREAVERMVATPGAVGLALSLADRFGDHGLIAVLLAEPAHGEREPTLAVDTWLMSCRVIGRTAEEFLFNALVSRAMDLGYAHLRAEFIPTKKNAMVADLFDRLGFTRLAEGADGRVTYGYAVTVAQPARTFVRGLALAVNA